MATSAFQLEVIERLEDIPPFETEQEESEFWDTHTFSDALWNSLPREDGLLPPGTRMGVGVTLAGELADRLRRLARVKNVSYVDLARTFVAERLYEEEKREGIIGDSKAS